MDINNNPWKGLDSYSYSDKNIFYGRNIEIEALIDTIVNNRFTILYGPSGVGKSSLLNAGIRPRLSENNYFVVDVSMRLLELNSDKSISSQIISRIEECSIEKKVDITPLLKDEYQDVFGDSLWYFFHTHEFWSAKNELLIPIVIIDQFEDIFKDETRNESPQSFFNNLDELSNVVPPVSIRENIKDVEEFRYNQSSDFRFVFSLREDYIPRLDDYVYSINIPELRKSRYGITLMSPDQAREVILEPAKEVVSEKVAEDIIILLSAQSSQNRLSHRIEPFLLSLFMYRVYIEMLKRGLSTISEDLINKIGADVVNDYYVESMKKVSSRAMKHLENVLLTPKGHRDSISYDKLMESEKVTEDELKTLLSCRIIKKNTVNNVDRFEFTHDILSKYAQKNKEKREQNNKSQIYVGYLGTFITLVLSVFIGWEMSSILTFVCIPILTVVTIICSYSILNVKLTSTKKRSIVFLIVCGLCGFCLDLIQIIPAIGYITYGLICLCSFVAVKKFSDYNITKTSFLAKYASVVFVWLLSFVIIPVLCYGYNIYKGMNYSRGFLFSPTSFYVKNIDGKYGVRDRNSIIIPPQYDDILQAIGKEYIAKANGKFGLLDSAFQIRMPLEYESYIVSDDKAYFYLDGKEISENGLAISWNQLVSDTQKNALRSMVKNMILVKGGKFEMGTNVKRISRKYSGFKPTNGEEHIHTVNLTDYYLGKYEVTIGNWIDIMGFDPRKRVPILKADSIDNLNLPVYKVSYEDCQKFVDKISELAGISFSLPTEAQWEYAARGGINHDEYDFAGSNSEFDVGWVDRNSDHIPHIVGEKGVKGENSLGFSDMTGNVSEFCKDCMSISFYRESIAKTNPCCESGEIVKSKKVIVLRGGSYESIQPENYIITRRMKAFANLAYRSSGFRLAIQSTK